MKPMIGSAAWAACLWLSLFAPGFSQTETDRSQVEPAWGEEVRGILAGLVVEQAEFESGENVGIMIALHVHNDNPEQVTLPTADGEAGWRWEFYLSGGGNPFVARWNDDTGGMGAGGGPLVLEPGASKVIQARLRQRSFNKWGAGYSSLVPGKYRVSAIYTHPRYVPEGSQPAWEIVTGTVEIEILPRGNDWDKVATADATTLVGLLGDRDRLLCTAATVFLRERGKSAVPALLEGLKDDNEWTRATCVELLGMLRKDAEPEVVDALIETLGDSDAGVRRAAASSLGLIGEAAKPAAPALLSMVKEPFANTNTLGNVQPTAASALCSIGDVSPEAIAAITGLLNESWVQHNSSRAYSTVVYALGSLGPEARDAVPVFVEHLENMSDTHRFCVIRALRRIGPDAQAAVPTLVRMLEDEGENIDNRVDVAYTLGCIASEDALAALERARDKYGDVDPEDGEFGTLARIIQQAIEEIHRVDSPLPVQSGNAGELQSTQTPDTLSQ